MGPGSRLAWDQRSRLPFRRSCGSVRRVPPVERDRILAFRLASHHLTERLGPRSLVRAAAACGVQETPLGTAAVALAARVEGITPAAMDRALHRDRTLLHLWSLRGAPHVVPTRDLEVFTAGAMPADRASFDAFLGGWPRRSGRPGWTPSTCWTGWPPRPGRSSTAGPST